MIEIRNRLTLVAAAAMAAAVPLLALAGCGPRDAGPGAEKPTLTVYMWSEYIDPEIPKEFERETGIPVRIDVYEATEDMMAKLQQGGDQQYDLLVVSDHAVPALAGLGLLAPLDRARLANAGNVDPRFAAPPYDPEGKWSVPYQWGTVGLMYRKDRLPDFEPTWALLFDPERRRGPFVLVDSMRDMLGVALKAAGESVNATDPEVVRAAGERTLAAKRSDLSLGFEGGVGGKNKVLSGAAALAVVYNGDALRGIEEDPETAFAVPREGSIVWVDAMAIPAHAPHPAEAHRFIDYILRPEVGARLSSFNRYATPNRAALPHVDARDRADPAIYPPPEVMAKLEYIQDVGAATQVYDEVWTAVKSR